MPRVYEVGNSKLSIDTTSQLDTINTTQTNTQTVGQTMTKAKVNINDEMEQFLNVKKARAAFTSVDAEKGITTKLEDLTAGDAINILRKLESDAFESESNGTAWELIKSARLVLCHLVDSVKQDYDGIHIDTRTPESCQG